MPVSGWRTIAVPEKFFCPVTRFSSFCAIAILGSGSNCPVSGDTARTTTWSFQRLLFTVLQSSSMEREASSQVIPSTSHPAFRPGVLLTTGVVAPSAPSRPSTTWPWLVTRKIRSPTAWMSSKSSATGPALLPNPNRLTIRPPGQIDLKDDRALVALGQEPAVGRDGDARDFGQVVRQLDPGRRLTVEVVLRERALRRARGSSGGRQEDREQRPCEQLQGCSLLDVSGLDSAGRAARSGPNRFCSASSSSCHSRRFFSRT